MAGILVENDLIDENNNEGHHEKVYKVTLKFKKYNKYINVYLNDFLFCRINDDIINFCNSSKKDYSELKIKKPLRTYFRLYNEQIYDIENNKEVIITTKLVKRIGTLISLAIYFNNSFSLRLLTLSYYKNFRLDSLYIFKENENINNVLYEIKSYPITNIFLEEEIDEFISNILIGKMIK